MPAYQCTSKSATPKEQNDFVTAIVLTTRKAEISGKNIDIDLMVDIDIEKSCITKSDIEMSFNRPLQPSRAIFDSFGLTGDTREEQEFVQRMTPDHYGLYQDGTMGWQFDVALLKNCLSNITLFRQQ
jgi:hypothetical protein